MCSITDWLTDCMTDKLINWQSEIDWLIGWLIAWPMAWLAGWHTGEIGKESMNKINFRCHKFRDHKLPLKYWSRKCSSFSEIHTVRLQNHWMHFLIDSTFMLLTFIFSFCVWKLKGMAIKNHEEAVIARNSSRILACTWKDSNLFWN